MSFGAPVSLTGMTDTTVSNIGVAMFTVSDQDAALAFYRDKLGYEVRADVRFGENDAMRWLEVAPPSSSARLALNSPMNDSPGGSSIGVETKDLAALKVRLQDSGNPTSSKYHEVPGGVVLDFSDPDGNPLQAIQLGAQMSDFS